MIIVDEKTTVQIFHMFISSLTLLHTNYDLFTLCMFDYYSKQDYTTVKIHSLKINNQDH
jgi:hypothetical protein